MPGQRHALHPITPGTGPQVRRLNFGFLCILAIVALAVNGLASSQRAAAGTSHADRHGAAGTVNDAPAGMATGATCACGDLDGDGSTSLADFQIMHPCLTLAAPGATCTLEILGCSDLNSDGRVDLRDYSALALQFGEDVQCDLASNIEFGIRIEDSLP